MFQTLSSKEHPTTRTAQQLTITKRHDYHLEKSGLTQKYTHTS